MKKIVCLLLSLGMFLIPTHATASDEMTMVTGSQTGTYYQIGLDIRKLLYPELKLTILASPGAFVNLLAMGYQNIPLGIIQFDVLDSLLIGSDDVTLRGLAQSIRVIFPLYNEEIHLLVSSEIKQLSDLNGKSVAIGNEGSGTSLTVPLLLKALDIKPSKQSKMGGGDAINELRAGNIDAMFFVVGAPASLFQTQIKADDKFHLLPITADLGDTFSAATIPAGTYAWQKTAVKTVAIKAFLVTKAFQLSSPECPKIGFLARSMYKQLDELKKTGHSKWKNVDFDYDTLLKHRALSICALQELKRAKLEETSQ
jgi:hypothetical protein